VDHCARRPGADGHSGFYQRPGRHGASGGHERRQGELELGSFQQRQSGTGNADFASREFPDIHHKSLRSRRPARETRPVALCSG